MKADCQVRRYRKLNIVMPLVAILILATSKYSLGDALQVVKDPSNITKVATGTYIPPSAQVSTIMLAKLNGLAPIGADAQKYDEEINDKGIHPRDGAIDDVAWANEKILAQDDHGTFCRGFTLEKFLNALKDANCTASLDSVKSLRSTWFSNDPKSSMAVQAIDDLQKVDPAKTFQGKALPLSNPDLSQVTAGDVLMLGRADGSEHCAIFLNWLVDAADYSKIVGVVYFSSQKWSTGCVGVSKQDWENSNRSVIPLQPISGQPTPNVPVTNLGSGYGPRSEFFDSVTFNPTPADAGKDIHGQVVAAKSYCFHFVKP